MSEKIDMIVGKVSFDGCTFSRANKLQRWLTGKIEMARGTDAQHLLPMTITTPLKPP